MSTEFIIAVDLDGTVIDFMKKANEITGMDVKEGELDVMEKHLKSRFWGRICRHVAMGGKFFEEMELLPDAMELWSYITRYDHFILTAAGKRIPNADAEKRASVVRHFGPQVRVEVVDSAKAKAEFARSNIILIDDRHKACKPFEEAGGIAIHHTSAASTIKQLQKMGL